MGYGFGFGNFGFFRFQQRQAEYYRSTPKIAHVTRLTVDSYGKLYSIAAATVIFLSSFVPVHLQLFNYLFIHFISYGILALPPPPPPPPLLLSCPLPLTTRFTADLIIAAPSVDTSRSRVWLLYVFADNCAGCGAFEPTWTEAANRLRHVLTLGSVHADFEPGLTKHLGVRFVPALVGLVISPRGDVKVKYPANSAALTYGRANIKNVLDFAEQLLLSATNADQQGMIQELASPGTPERPTTFDILSRSMMASSFPPISERVALTSLLTTPMDKPPRTFAAAFTKLRDLEAVPFLPRVLVLSRRPTPSEVLRALARHFANTFEFHYLCLECTRDLPNVLRLMGLAVTSSTAGVPHVSKWPTSIFIQANRFGPYTLLAGRLPILIEPTSSSSSLSARRVPAPKVPSSIPALVELLSLHDTPLMPEMTGDNLFHLCYRNRFASSHLASPSSPYFSKLGQSPPSMADLNKARRTPLCLLFLPRGAAPSLSPAMEHVLGIEDVPLAGSVDQAIGSVAQQQQQQQGARHAGASSFGYVQVGWVNAREQATFLQNFIGDPLVKHLANPSPSVIRAAIKALSSSSASSTSSSSHTAATIAALGTSRKVVEEEWREEPATLTLTALKQADKDFVQDANYATLTRDSIRYAESTWVLAVDFTTNRYLRARVRPANVRSFARQLYHGALPLPSRLAGFSYPVDKAVATASQSVWGTVKLSASAMGNSFMRFADRVANVFSPPSSGNNTTGYGERLGWFGTIRAWAGFLLSKLLGEGGLTVILMAATTAMMLLVIKVFSIRDGNMQGPYH